MTPIGIQGPTCTLQCTSRFRHNGHKEQRSVTAQPIAAIRQVCVPAQVRSLWAPTKPRVFTSPPCSHASEPFSPGRHRLDGLQCNLSAAIAFAQAGEEGTKASQAWLLCLFVSHMSGGCNTNNAMPAKRMQVINCWWEKKKTKEKTHYPNAIKNPNDKSCLVSRWIMLMLVACAHRVRRLAPSTAARRHSACHM